MSETYAAAAHFAQSWGLLYFFLVFVAVVLFVMRPSRKARYEDAARLPIREDD
jgi:cytochrome c oxidase cbb3-type subunit 4